MTSLKLPPPFLATELGGSVDPRGSAELSILGRVLILHFVGKAKGLDLCEALTEAYKLPGPPPGPNAN